MQKVSIYATRLRSIVDEKRVSMMMRTALVFLISLLLVACSGRNVGFDEPGLDAGTSETSDAASVDAGAIAAPGSSPSSCGSASPVDCTEFGDGDATCMDSSHCACSLDDNYKCEGASDENGAECAPGVVCVVKREAIDSGRVGNASSSCGDPANQGLIPIDCTRYGDLSAVCVFGNHCMCSPENGFRCQEIEGLDPPVPGARECAPGAYCIPDN